MVENGEEVEANTECRFGLGWVYYNNYCYIFTSYHESFLSVRNRLIKCESKMLIKWIF